MEEQNWADDAQNADIEAGDTVTLVTESEIDDFDESAAVTAAESPDDNSWMEIESPSDAVYVVTPNTDGDHSGALYQGSSLSATGVISNKQRIAWVDGIESVEEA